MSPQRKDDADGPSGPSRFGQGSSQAIVAEPGGLGPWTGGEFRHRQPVGKQPCQTVQAGPGTVGRLLFKNDQTGETELLNLTDYQAKYFAHELTRRFPPDSVEKVTVAFAGAQVDLNPHQIDAALFAFK